VVKVLDMGVARFSQEDDEVLTKGPLGTADYLAPEQALDSHGADRRADIYSLGATFYFLLTGTAPFSDGKTVAQKIMLLQTKAPRPISEFRHDVPPGVESIVTRMMAKKADVRFQTMDEVMEALEPLTEKPIPSPPDREMPVPIMGASPGEGTDVNLGLTPVGGPGGSGRNLKARATTPAAKEESAAQSSSMALVVVLSVLVTAAVAAGVWWTFLRPGQ
jgi:serine/threonine protein kinase